ncbi:MAG: SpoIIE family protein phosphatase [Ruminiclostridium sp.]|nr:SpoIIE family protein phosphatase [Ruminiclostridium sp.]
MDHKKTRISLKVKAVLIVILMALALCASAIGMSYYTFVTTDEAMFKRHVKDIVWTAAQNFGGDDLKKVKESVLETYTKLGDEDIVTSGDWGSDEFNAYLARYAHIKEMPEYRSVYDALAKTRDLGIAALASIYTIIYDNSRSEPYAIYVVDASHGEACEPGCLDSFYSEDDLSVIDDPTKGLEPYTTATDTYGRLVVSGAPIYDSNGEYVALFCIDLSMDDIKADEMRFFLRLALTLAGVTAVICIINILVISKTVISPIKKLSDAAADYVSDSGKTATFSELDIDRGDEIGELADAMKAMEHNIRDYIDDITNMTSERERIGAELGVASTIQMDMMPVNFPERSDIELHAAMIPAKEVGGDFYDFFFPDKDHLAMVMADVSGKGIPAALFMVISKSVIRNITMVGGTPAEILGVVNNILCENNKNGYFVTAWLGILDLTTGILTHSNAGHEYPAIRHAGEEYKLVVTDHGPPLAAIEDTSYEDETAVLEPGDSVFIYTDGVTEAKKPSGERYGEKRMTSLLNSVGNAGQQVIISSLKSDIDDFIEGSDPFDDITMLAFRYLGNTEVADA